MFHLQSSLQNKIEKPEFFQFILYINIIHISLLMTQTQTASFHVNAIFI